MPDWRHPIQIPVEMRAQRVDAVVDIAVVVVEDVLAPVGRAAVVLAAVVGLVDALQAQFEVRPEPVANPRPDAPTPPRTLAPARSRSWASWPLTLGLIAGVAAMVVWLVGSTPTPAETGMPGVAVLAFSGDDQQLAARMTEYVTAELARLGTVSVASHTSAMQFAGKRAPLTEISAALNVDFVVEASIDQEPEGLLVVVRIVDTATNRKVWIADYRGAAGDQSAISQRVAFDVGAELIKRSP